ncbi:MAG: CAP domain-containing protein [Paenisporosarcina sp.]
MRTIVLVLTLTIGAYVSSPLWEEYADNYIDTSFLDKIETQVQRSIIYLKGQPLVTNSIETIQTAITTLPIKLIEDKNQLIASPIEELDKPTLATPTEGLFSVHNIEIGDKKETIEADLGKPKRVTANEYGTSWHTYHTGYQNFFMVSYDTNNKVNGLFTNNDLIASTLGIELNSSRDSVRKALGEPLKYMTKGNTNYILNNKDESDTFLTEHVYATIFYDVHENNTVTAIQILSENLERHKSSIYAKGSVLLQEGLELQLFDLTNSARVHHGVPAVKWDSLVQLTAHDHSLDMATQNYFSHTNLQGESPFDRMNEDGISYRVAGENLAYGQSSSVFAHEGLMNSIGHRENLLKPEFALLGIGVAFNEENQPYYTENFYTK